MPTSIDPDGLLDLLRADVGRVLALRDADRSAPVAACPGWSLVDLVEHTAGVFRFATTQLRAAPGDPLRPFDPLPQGLDPFDLFEREATALEAELIGVDPDEHRPNWAGAPTAAWYFRRMAHEMAVHRWDAEAAARTPSPIPTAQAVDGIDELCDVYFADAAARGVVGTGETVHLHCTDTDEGVGEWMFTFHGEGVDVERRHGKGDMAGRGTASDLLLFCWNRRPVDVATFGQPDLMRWWPEKVRW